ncbi:MAG: ATP-binding protein [bacterium]
MREFEKLGVFYLGRLYDLRRERPGEGLVLYDSRDLVTHALCVGMTGSGKTGLCLSLLEEAALDGIPAIAIDPKGDLGNLLLTFPLLRPEDFLPWVNPEDARNQGMTVEAYAQQQAERWTRGLGEWGQDSARIRRLREAADFAIYTPGSSAGLPVSILKSFAAPPEAIRADAELLAERISTTATGLLTLVGVEADPLQSREHILLSTILEATWRGGRDVDLAGLIQQIQTPPVPRIGVLDLDAFYPPSERFALAMRLNNLLAAPGFAAWLEGDPLDVDRFLHTANGKPRVSIFSIAHLSDNERMFFVTLLLNQVLGWMRAQSGTTSLRAVLYMDEIFGYFPPVANPPSKLPLLTLLKQARAFGLGVVLATQNPVDLDYKGLANAGTWLLGRLQTDRDKARVLDGLEGAAAGGQKALDRRAMDEILSALKSRVFLLHNVHEDGPVVMETRWAMSYLRGPLTRDQIRTLMAPAKQDVALERAAAGPATSGAPPLPAASTVRSAAQSAQPVLPADIPQHFVPRRSPPTGPPIVYLPFLFGSARVQFIDEKRGIDLSRDVAVLAPFQAGALAVDWARARPSPLRPDELEAAPGAGSRFADLPAAALKLRNYEAWSKDFAKWLYQNERLDLWRSPSLRLVSRPEETERDFRIRLADAARERRDEVTARLRAKYAPRISVLSERVRRAQQAAGREAEQQKQQRVQTAVSLGATILGAFIGRKAASHSTLGRATTAARGASRSMKEAEDVRRAGETVAVLQGQLTDLEAQFQAEVAPLDAGGPVDPLDPIALKPKRSQIAVQFIGLAWAPHRQEAEGALIPAWE